MMADDERAVRVAQIAALLIDKSRYANDGQLMRATGEACYAAVETAELLLHYASGGMPPAPTSV